MTDEKQEKAIPKISKKTSVRIWTESTGSKSANENAWDKAVRKTNNKRPNVLDPKQDGK